ncbi:MAG TPA: formyltransferase family protein [Gemmatimonadaceae bacterium]|nr:formyltransferase family protein [Gemmatimonadaceae bacterium]
MSATPLRVVVLTSTGRYGVEVLGALRAHGVAPHATLVQTRPDLADCFRRRSRVGRAAELPAAAARWLWRRLRPRLLRDLRPYRPLTVTGVAGSSRLGRDLARLAPDLLVLAGCGIVPPEQLAIPRLGTVNAHPGLLPWVRGNGVVAHALVRGVAVGASCHLVDRGIDTGPLVRRRLLAVDATHASLRAVNGAATVLAAQLLAEVVAEIVRHRALPTAVAQTDRWPLCRWSSAVEAGAEAAVQAGRARALFDAWRVHCTDPRSLDLPTPWPHPPPVPGRLE